MDSILSADSLLWLATLGNNGLFYFIAILVLGVLIFVHELGHFLVAKLFGVGALEFAIGFGRQLLRIQGRETTYTLRAIPLGGFVRMVGEDPRFGEGEVDPNAEQVGGASVFEGTQDDLTPAQRSMMADEGRWFTKKPYLVRCAVIVAGPLANFLFAWAVGTGMFYVQGIPESSKGPVVIGALARGLPAEKAGLKSGDEIISVDGQEIASYNQMVDIVRSSQGKPLTFVLKRVRTLEGEGATPAQPLQYDTQEFFDTKEFTVQPQSEFRELDVVEGARDGKPTYRIGLSPAVVFVPCSLYEAVAEGGAQVVGLVTQTLRVFKGLLTLRISPEKAVGGPIEIIKQTASSAQRGFGHLMMITILINIALGVMNLLPIPVLDGGQILLITLERIKGAPLSPRTHAIATQIGLIFIMLLMIFAFGNDLRRTFFS
jgi:regulator of sigma E protease